MEKAKEAAANLDQQLNESVGVESTPAKPTIASGGGTDATSTWNDDDFKFDDDDEEQVVAAAPILELKPPPPPTPKPPTKEDEVAALLSAMSTPTTKSPAAAPAAPAAAVEAPKPEPVETPEKGAWADVDNTDFDNFDGVAPQENSAAPAPAPAQESPASALGGAFAGALKANLGGLGEKVGGLGEKVSAKVPVKPNDINFMSPFSSLMTSISQDQDKEEEPTAAAAEEKAVPETPQKEKEETKPNVPEATQEDVTEAAWQEEDIDIGDEDGKPEAAAMPKKTEPPADKPEPPKPEEPEKKQEEPAAAPVKEEKKTEEKQEQPEKVEEEPKAEAPPQEKAAAPAEEISKETPQSTPTETKEKAAPDAAPASPDGPVVSSAELEQVKKLLSQREEQLAAKAEQMFQLQQMYEKEKQELSKKLSDTKEEAKKRILKAKERCEAAEAKLQASTAALTEDAAQQAEVVAALRQEGEKLAHKQSEMERTVRAARGEARELKETLEIETIAKEDALAKIEKLQAELKSTQENLSSARKGETQAGKLDVELQAAREDIANKENAIMSLEATVKELKAEKKKLIEDVETSQQGMAEDNMKEAKKMRKEHNTAVSDLEAKLATSEREAALREDQLRHEVEELRKRWQDAVRRADALSMDVQSSTAPLLRQLESVERQNRARASAAAELETKLRAELEETVIKNEKLSKDFLETKTKHGRLERLTKEQESDLADRQKAIDDMTAKIKRLEDKLQEMQIEAEKKQEEYEKVERLANEGVSKVRSEMSQAVLDSEERYRSQLEAMKEELKIEQDKRSLLEKQVDKLVENAAVIIPNPSKEFVAEQKPAKLVKSEGQAQILSGALKGLGSLSDDDNETDDEDLELPPAQSSTGSFAALSQLTQNLKTAKKELEALRKQLTESEKTRESLVEELGESRDAKEKLPLFEAKVKELMADNKEKELEIRGLQDDIADVKEMYRTQLNVLLEEKAAAFATVAKDQMNGSSNEPAAEEPVEEKVPELVEDALGIS